jgi:hypothetical protein
MSISKVQFVQKPQASTVKSANSGRKFYGRDGNFHGQGTIPENIRQQRLILDVAEAESLIEHDLLDQIEMSDKWMAVDLIVGRAFRSGVFEHTVVDHGDDWTDLIDEEVSYCPADKLKDQLQLLLVLDFETINDSGHILKPKKMTSVQSKTKNDRDNMLNSLMQLAAK